MRIGIYGEIFSAVPCGMKRYAYNLASGLLTTSNNNQIIVLLRKKIPPDFFCKGHNIKLIYPPRIPFISYKTMWKKVLFPMIIEKLKLDLIHFPSNIIPRSEYFAKYNGKMIVTIHDIIPLMLRNYYSNRFCSNRSYRKYYENIKFTVENCDKIIADSDHSRNDIINFFKVSGDKVKTIYPGIDKIFYYKNYTNDVLSNIKKMYLLPDEFLLYIGGHEKRKNIDMVVKAYKIFITRSQKNDVKLVIIAATNSYIADIKSMVNNLKLKENVFFFDCFPDEILSDIYRLSKALIYPSLYEGFGFPPLEAMACGCPVITSNTSSLPEVVGDAGILIDPYNVEEIADAIEKVLSDEQSRKDLIRKGLNRVKEFSWEKTAKETIEVYKKVCYG